MATSKFKRNYTQRAYRLNHSDLRAITRCARDRAKKLREVCKERQFWKGDKYNNRPTDQGAIAALRVLEDRERTDFMQAKQDVQGWCDDRPLRIALARASIYIIRDYKTRLPA